MCTGQKLHRLHRGDPYPVENKYCCVNAYKYQYNRTQISQTYFKQSQDTLNFKHLADYQRTQLVKRDPEQQAGRKCGNSGK